MADRFTCILQQKERSCNSMVIVKSGQGKVVMLLRCSIDELLSYNKNDNFLIILLSQQWSGKRSHFVGITDRRTEQCWCSDDELNKVDVLTTDVLTDRGRNLGEAILGDIMTVKKITFWPVHECIIDLKFFGSVKSLLTRVWVGMKQD